MQLIGSALSRLWIDMGGNLTDATGAGASSVRGEVNLYDQFGAVLLLQGLYDLWPNWYLWETWGNHKFEVQRILRELANYLPISIVPATRVEGAEDNSVHCLQDFLRTVERELVPYLQSESDLASSFQNYLRRPQHSWKEFFEMKLEFSESDLCFVGEHVKREVCKDFEFLVKVLLENKPPHAPEDTDRHTHIGKYTRERYVPCAVSAAWFEGKCDADGFARHLLPRFYLLQALFDKQAILASTYKTPALQKKMFREISGLLALIRDAAAQSPNSVSEVVDRFLVPYLHLESELAMLLTDYLPKRHQSWKAFLDFKLGVEEKGFFGLNGPSPKHAVQLELSNTCKSLVKKLYYRFKFYKFFTLEHLNFLATLDVEEVDIFYATDRLVTEDGEYIGQAHTSKYWRKGKELLHYGLMTMGIPDVRNSTSEYAGNFESVQEHNVRIVSMDTRLQHDQGGFVEMINKKLDKVSEDERRVLLYIHGYNVNHKDAIKRAARLKYYMCFRGIVVVYSWPSKGTLWGYAHDEKMIKNSAELLYGLIETILTKVRPDTKVQIHADDMGNRALIRAFDKSKNGNGIQRQSIREVDINRTLKNVVFWAPDAMWAEFENMGLDVELKSTGDPESPPCIFKVCIPTRDQNLLLSKAFHGKSQLVDLQSLQAKYSRTRIRAKRSLLKSKRVREFILG